KQIHIDVDGCSSTVLLVHFIRRFGGNVRFLIPDRVQDGYGLSPALVDRALACGSRLIVTVDNGIAALSGVRRARELDIHVVVTDHHLPGTELPEPYALVNPNHPDCPFPFKSTCGVGVAWYLAGVTWRVMVDAGAIPDTPVMQEYLDLVALGTVADVVPLERNNRFLVRAGLRRMRRGLARPGLQALMRVCGIEESTLTEQDFGFRLAPRLNAAGRLEDMAVGVNLLLADDLDTALPIASALDVLNKDRREIEQGMLAQAEDAVARVQSLCRADDEPAMLCILDPDGHEGVVGLVAGRLRERYHKPSIVFAPGAHGLIKGSARSVDGVHIRDFIADIAAEHPGLIHAFGGHAMAAGLSLPEGHFERFAEICAERARRTIAPELLCETILTDGEVAPEYLNMTFAQHIVDAGPWGNGFPPPLFEGEFTVLESKRVGADGKTLRMRVRPVNSRPSAALVAVTFRRDTEIPDPEEGSTVRLAYSLDINRFRGDESVQLMVRTVI
ncbi:single-stranded-DNA-specific exonuclease RecJ, partial [Acidithiobacillus ferridurans]|uniref:single-stranded-DNA-specific exonuclease RecJ n=1 Tax=Acidithiobacillus ferridurans TaxID=1232575 RepID=UPI001C069C5D